MKRTQIQLDMPTWELLRQTAFERKSSIAAVIRELIQNQIKTKQKAHALRMKDFSFIGSGRSQGRGSGTIARRHDEEITDSIL